MERKRIGIYLDEFVQIVKRVPTEDIINKRVVIREYTKEISDLLDKKFKKYANKVANNPIKMADIWTFNESFVLKAIDRNPEVIQYINYKLSEKVQLYILDNYPDYFMKIHFITKDAQIEAIKRYPDWIEYDRFKCDINCKPDSEIQKKLEMIAITEKPEAFIHIRNPHIDTCIHILEIYPKLHKWVKIKMADMSEEDREKISEYIKARNINID